MQPLEGRLLCHVAWRNALGISETSFRRYIKQVFGRQVEHDRIPRQSILNESSFLWLHSFCEENGEQAPNLNKVYLPSWLTKKNVYTMYCAHFANSDSDPMSQVHLIYFVI